MMVREISYPSSDGLQLRADLFTPDNPVHLVVMIHGITTDRREGGLYTGFAEALCSDGIAAFTFDFRGHGESGGSQEILTLAGVLNDLLTSIRVAREETGLNKFSLIAASFGGGIAIRAANLNSQSVQSVALLNPRLEYESWVTAEEYWLGDRINEDAALRLHSRGYLPHNEFKMGIALINEVLQFNPAKNLKQVACPILFVHGTHDSIIPIASSRTRYNENGQGSLIEIAGADHGFVNPDNDSDDDPLSKKFQAKAQTSVVSFIRDIVNVT